MNAEKIDIDLSGVKRTLLLPLLGRAMYSQEKQSPFYDEYAIKFLQSLNFDSKELIRQVGHSRLIRWMARAFQFDQAIRFFKKPS